MLPLLTAVNKISFMLYLFFNISTASSILSQLVKNLASSSSIFKISHTEHPKSICSLAKFKSSHNNGLKLGSKDISIFCFFASYIAFFVAILTFSCVIDNVPKWNIFEFLINSKFTSSSVNIISAPGFL